jgi:hypothetical protein
MWKISAGEIEVRLQLSKLKMPLQNIHRNQKLHACSPNETISLKVSNWNLIYKNFVSQNPIP